MTRNKTVLTSRLGVLLATTALVAGCTQGAGGTDAPSHGDGATSATPDGKVPPTAPAPTSGYAWLAAAMPSAAELSSALGRRVGNSSNTPFVGDISDLRDTFAGSRAVVEDQCIGVVSPFEKRVYGSTPVRAVTFGTESTSTFGAVALASNSDARSLFSTLRDQWQECDGMALTKADTTYTFTHKISEVTGTDDVVSATDIMTSNSPTGVPVVTARALGLAEDCIVEAEVIIADPPPSDSLARDPAVALVQLISTKIMKSQR
ncbi:sensor domain-containing protein [Mycolicibacterium septicum]|nr:sensor domain-containing protein [Mycolicibacterium septicum]